MGACPLARSGAWIGESSEPIGAFRRSRSLRRLLAVATLLVWLPGGAQPAGMASAAFPPAEHDAVVSPLDPLHVRIPAGNVTAARRARVRVWNADTEGTQTIRLAAASIDCPGVRLTSPPSFGAAAPSSPDLVSLAAGESAIARLAIEVNADSLPGASPVDPHRCTLVLTATTVAPEGSIDPTPTNNLATLDLDVTSVGNRPEVGDGWAVGALGPVTLTPRPVASTAIARVAVRVSNADPASAPGDPGQSITVAASDGDCPAGTVGTPDFDGRVPDSQTEKVIAPARTARARLRVSIDLRMLARSRRNAPGRCTALVSVHGPAGRADRDPSNDVARLVLQTAASVDPGRPDGAIEITTPADRSQAPADGRMPVVIRFSPDLGPRPRVLIWTGIPPREVDVSSRFSIVGGSAIGTLSPANLVPGLSVLVAKTRSPGGAIRSASLLFSWEPAIDASSADRCELLGQSRCLLPFPSDWFTVADALTDTGRRVRFDRASLPANVSGVQVDPVEWNRNDGFSPAAPILAHVPGVDLVRSGAAPITDIGRSLDEGAPIVLLDAETGEFHPYFAELDANATSDAGRALLVWPVRNLVEGHRYVVAFRRLEDASGVAIAPSRAFAVYRDHEATFLSAVEDRRARMERIFEDLSAAGIAREDLQLAWDFTVASERSLSERLLHIRDDAFALLGDAVPPFTVTSVEDDADAYVYRRIRGTYEVPSYLTGAGGVGSRFHYAPGADPDALPERNGTFIAEFACWVPRSTTADGNDPVTPGRPVLDGHGLFQDIPEYLERPRPLAYEHNLVQCMSNWIGQTSEDIPQARSALGEVSLSPTIYDRAQQGILNYLFLGRLMKDPRGFASHPAFRAGAATTPVLAPGELFYVGGSQAAALGGVATAVASDWTRAVLVVPPMNFSLLETRSSHWAEYGPYRNEAYTDELDRALLFAIVQMLQDRSEPSAYAGHVIADPYPATPAHEVLLIEAFGDYQVANIATENEARSMGVQVWRPFLAPGRSPDLTPAWGLPAIPEVPFRGSALVMWDFGRPAPPTANIPPPWSGSDPHGGPSSDPRVRRLISDFVRADGAFIDVCDGGPCQSDVLDGTSALIAGTFGTR